MEPDQGPQIIVTAAELAAAAVDAEHRYTELLGASAGGGFTVAKPSTAGGR